MGGGGDLPLINVVVSIQLMCGDLPLINVWWSPYN